MSGENEVTAEPDGRAYDDRGNVRPADSRWLGDANDDQPEEPPAEEPAAPVEVEPASKPTTKRGKA